jgi:predicted dehydrogenase
MRVAIIGSGLQCRRRAPVVKEWPGAELAVIASLHLDHAKEQAAKFGCEASDDWKAVVARKDIDVVLVCTPPHVHAEMTIAALESGKHVLCEKPLAKTIVEAADMDRAARKAKRVLKCGFNHRHHPAVWQAKKMVDEGKLGRVMFMRCRYGICGRPGYEKEWRADPKRAAGGQFIEQGTHAIDLFRWFAGDFDEVTCMTSIRYFREQKMEDNGMAVFRMADGAIASLHTSLTQWKNLFSFEVFGEDGYAQVEGLGASYGVERLITGKRDFTAPFHDDITEYPGPDVSWKEEWAEFMAAIREGRKPIGDADDGYEALSAALAAYESQKKGRTVQIMGLLRKPSPLIYM